MHGMDADGDRLEVGALSETGYARDENQDRMSGSHGPLGHLYIVADGMGGHKGGALAAQMAVEELRQHIGEAAPGVPVDSAIQAAFQAANDAVYQKARSGDPAEEGMGTTAVLLLVAGRVATVAHVGDSRAYLYRDKTLSQLTTDHTVVQRMVQAGMLKPDEASDHPQASVLDRAIGSTPTVEVDIHSHQLRDGDTLLLCSDGLCGYVTDAQIHAVLRHRGSVQETTAGLVQLALDTGGKDNVTVQLIRYGSRRPSTRGTRFMNALARFAVRPGRGERRTVAAIVMAVAVAVVGAAIVGGVFWRGRDVKPPAASGPSKETTPPAAKPDQKPADQGGPGVTGGTPPAERPKPPVPAQRPDAGAAGSKADASKKK